MKPSVLRVKRHLRLKYPFYKIWAIIPLLFLFLTWIISVLEVLPSGQSLRKEFNSAAPKKIFLLILSQHAGRKVCSIPSTEHPLPKQWGVQGGGLALDCSPQEDPAARQSFDLNHKGCCFHKTCWQNWGDRRGSEKEKKKKKGNLKLQSHERCVFCRFSSAGTQGDSKMVGHC